MLQVGDTAPDFTLPDEQGNTVTLSSFRGKNPVVLIFYPGDQTPVCTRQLCGIRDSYDEFTAVNAVVLGVNPGSQISHKKFANINNFQFPLLVDKERTAARDYDVLLLNIGPLSVVNRTVYGIGVDGTIVFAERGSPDTETIVKAIADAAHAANGG